MRQQIYPLNTAVKKQIPNIMKTFFQVLLFLIKIIIPRPELTSSPASKAPNDKELFINNSVIKIEDAQLGINPMIEANKGAKYLLLIKKLEKFSFPTASIINPNPALIIKT